MWFITFLFINLRRRLSRTMLTIGGIAVAVGTSIALPGIADGFRRSTLESLGARGVEVLVMEEGKPDQLSSELEETSGKYLREVPGVKAISPGLIDMIDYSTDDGVINLIIQGWRADTFMFPAMEFIDGGPFKTDDEKSAVLGAGRAKALGLKVGDTIMIQREAFKVVGIWQGYGLFDNNTVTVPLKQLQELMVRDNAVTGFSIRIDREAEGFTSVEDLCNQIDAIEDSDGRHMRMDAMTTEELAQNAMYLKMSSAMAWVTTAIAIAMGIFGMLNTMLMSVVERVREISILRALGWRRRSIVQMIMGESIIMCLAGGILGALLAVLGIRLLTRLPAVSGFIRPDIAPVVVLTGIGLAIVVAFVGGVYPAYRATRLRPAEGMSHE